MKCSEVARRFTASKAFRGQKWIARSAVVADEYGPLRTVVGLDVAYKRGGDGDIGIGVAVALSYPTLQPLSCVAAVRRVCIPYVPGLLAYREMAVLAPAMLWLLKDVKPDLVVVDGHGVAHPRGAGIATHVGVVFDLPSIGVAKKRLYGRETIVKGRPYLVDDKGRPIAAIIERGRSRIYVSPGHRVSVDTSARLVRTMLGRGKLPEPTRIADRLAKDLKRRAPAPECCDPTRIQCFGNSSGSTLF